MKKGTLLQISSLVISSILLLSYNEDPPNGRTGAPFDGNCGDCHNNYNPGNFNGIATIVGLPDTIEPNKIYSFQIKATVTVGNPVRAGFQLVVVDKNNYNAGNLSALDIETDTEFMNGREYLDQRGGKYFNTTSVSWNFSWTAPDSAACNTIKFYYIVNFCNGSGDFADFPIAFADSVYFAGEPPVAATVTTLQNNTCLEDLNGIAQAVAYGGSAPYAYHWSNGFTTANIESLATGIYAVKILDSNGCSVIDSTIINHQDTLIPQLICPSSVSACEADTVRYDLPIVSDNCDIGDLPAILIAGLPSNSIFPYGNTTQIFQATDFSGNIATCTFVVKIDSCQVGATNQLPPTKKFQLIPNPVSEAGFFILGGLEPPSALELLSHDGRVVNVFSSSFWPGPFFLLNIPPGLYILRIIYTKEKPYLVPLIKFR